MKKLLVVVLTSFAVAVAACGEAVAPLEILLVNLDLGNGEAQVWTEMSDAALSDWTPAQIEEFLDLQKQGKLEVANQLTPSGDWPATDYSEPERFCDATRLNQERDGNAPLLHAGDPHGQRTHIEGAFTNLDQWVERGMCPFEEIIVLVSMRDTAWELRQEYDCQAAVTEAQKDPIAQAIRFGGPDQIGEWRPSPGVARAAAAHRPALSETYPPVNTRPDHMDILAPSLCCLLRDNRNHFRPPGFPCL